MSKVREIPWRCAREQRQERPSLRDVVIQMSRTHGRELFHTLPLRTLTDRSKLRSVDVFCSAQALVNVYSILLALSDPVQRIGRLTKGRRKGRMKAALGYWPLANPKQTLHTGRSKDKKQQIGRDLGPVRRDWGHV